MKKVIERFFKWESASGVLLMAAALCALLIANSPWRDWYDLIIGTKFQIQLGEFGIGKPLLLWINDGLMAIFFLMVGLELKREILEGELSDPRKVTLPAIGAVGGMAIPAVIYILLNWGDAVALKGWAIPAATDIAFALGILSLLGSRVPVSLKVFLTSLAIFDDVGAIVIIAVFYTANIALPALMVAFVCVAVLAVFNYRGVVSRSLYFFVGAIMWVALLKSGVHATLSGVLLAFFIPMGKGSSAHDSPLKSLEHDLHTTVAFVILPVFAFANSGINLSGVALADLLHGVPLGVSLGLFIGKQLGIFTFCWLGIRMGLAALPAGMSWAGLYGTAILCGVGFTMSLFIGSLAFEETGVNLLVDERIGIIMGSLMSGLVGFFVLNAILRPAGAAKGTS
jgi:NhaA family Na+:H+ antiporter